MLFCFVLLFDSQHVQKPRYPEGNTESKIATSNVIITIIIIIGIVVILLLLMMLLIIIIVVIVFRKCIMNICMLRKQCSESSVLYCIHYNCITVVLLTMPPDSTLNINH